MKSIAFLFTLLSTLFSHAMIFETVYVESPTDTDGDGKKDLIYVSIERPRGATNIPTFYKITPYSHGGNQTKMHPVDVEYLPQDKKSRNKRLKSSAIKDNITIQENSFLDGFAKISAHSLGTGNSTGCPTIGDMNETLAAKSVIDWLNGDARAFDKDGAEVFATWASGNVGMMGVSYNGTLPTMVAATGVEGLKAIVPIAAISNWYDYYRANGLVVNPGGYIGEDADILGKFVVRRNACGREINEIAKSMGREHGDYHEFWQERDYLPLARNIKAATFIVHGQSDWNVKQKHAIDLWNALPQETPKRMFLHSGGHTNPGNRDYKDNVEKWFRHFVAGTETDVLNNDPIKVQEVGSSRIYTQKSWPHEATVKRKISFGHNDKLYRIEDHGSKQSMKNIVSSPDVSSSRRFSVVSDKLKEDVLLSGTPHVSLELSVRNRSAANLSVAIVEYGLFNTAKIITRGWADPQNYADIEHGEKLNNEKFYIVRFNIEPKQYTFSKGKRVGIIVTSTDYNYTLRPSTGTILDLKTGRNTYIELNTDKELVLK